jgi:hypothetical protein
MPLVPSPLVVSESSRSVRTSSRPRVGGLLSALSFARFSSLACVASSLSPRRPSHRLPLSPEHRETRCTVPPHTQHTERNARASRPFKRDTARTQHAHTIQTMNGAPDHCSVCPMLPSLSPIAVQRDTGAAAAVPPVAPLAAAASASGAAALLGQQALVPHHQSSPVGPVHSPTCLTHRARPSPWSVKVSARSVQPLWSCVLRRPLRQPRPILLSPWLPLSPQLP